jgi:hypothetical protein
MRRIANLSIIRDLPAGPEARARPERRIPPGINRLPDFAAKAALAYAGVASRHSRVAPGGIVLRGTCL